MDRRYLLADSNTEAGLRKRRSALVESSREGTTAVPCILLSKAG